MVIEQEVLRKESWDKVTGAARYVADTTAASTLHVALAHSTQAHARITQTDAEAARCMPGVRAVLLGRDVPILCGEEIRDRPILAIDTVRHGSEAIALVVADTLHQAKAAAMAIEVTYDPLPLVLSPVDAAAADSPLVHPNMMDYIQASPEILPETGTNIANRVRIRKGDAACALAASDVTVSLRISLPTSDHVAMETRAARAQIHPDGRVVIDTTTQAPYAVQSLISEYFGVPAGFVSVHVPLVGGGFGGKSTVQLELLAYAASRAVGGRPVSLVNTREEDMAFSACKEGCEADIRLGATRAGRLTAMEATYYLDAGAYADSIPRVARAVAADCTGPYHIENVCCDALCVYTNHPYATAYRGFGHIALTFAIERALDTLAETLGIDALALRQRNAIAPGHTSPTQSEVTQGNAGDFAACLQKLAEATHWPENAFRKVGEHKVRAMGLGCFWKAPSTKTDATSGVLLTFNPDGSLNLHCAVVECGPGTRTILAQIVAQAMDMQPDRVFIIPEFDTHVMPEHWKTVASMSTYLAGNAALRAVNDIKQQLRSIACVGLHALEDEVEIGGERAFLRSNPSQFIAFPELIHGFTLPTGHTIGAQVIGRGGYTVQRVSTLDEATGQGTPAPGWTVGAQAVEVEVDTQEWTYRLLNAYTVIDAGQVLNPLLTRGVVMGGMCMGLGLATREAFQFDAQGLLINGNLRRYKTMHIGEEVHYDVQFVQTPQPDAPFGARPIAEHGIIGIPAALANALSRASGRALNALPITPEVLWRAVEGGADDPV